MLIILGGTFDPPHNGHLQIAEHLWQTFNHQITFMPTGIPPYKAQPQVSNQQRLAMLNLAIADYGDRFTIDETEINQAEYCYTYKTLRQLRQKIGFATPIYFVIGSDSLISFDSWDNWQEILDYCSLIVVSRAHYDKTKMSSTLQQFVATRSINNIAEFKHHALGKICQLDFSPCDVSSTTIRQRLQQKLSCDNLLPPRVYEYIVNHGLYTPITATNT